MEKKVMALGELQRILETLKSEGKKVVHCHGCFDIVHYGHVRHFLSAKEQGDILVVTITPDRFIQKGPERPFFHEEIRLKHLASIECIDYVALNEWPTAVETIKIIRPDVYVKGKEVLANADVDKIENGVKTCSNLDIEIETVRSFGGRIHLTDDITFSSSRIINQITSSIPDETKQFLREFRKKYNLEYVENVLESLKNIRVLVIGDAILDQYVYCSILEKSAKNPIIPYKLDNSEVYLGGVFAVANHLAGFSNHVSLITCIGKKGLACVEKDLNERVNKTILIQEDSNTLIKKRYLDDYTRTKLFEVYSSEELEISRETEQKILNYLQENINNFDMILIPDFGHGLITGKIRDYLFDCGKFLAVNAQMNAGNLGYNFITRYKKANFVSLNERELRFPFQEKTSDIKIPIEKLSSQLNLDKINITLGKAGSVFYQGGNYFYVPSFTTDPVDTMGAGDAVLSLTSLLAYKNISPELLPFLGNSAGALAVKVMGNKEPVNPIELKKFIAYIMK